jgi:acetyl/propionyl-CoA carboxylase alpha subunit
VKRIRRLFIANRGEVACRIARSAQAQGMVTLAGFSDVDRWARHTQVCDQAVYLGEEGHGSPYLNIAKVIAAAQQVGADAVHPGYGFLSERAEFAEAVEAAGLIWVGPRPEVMTSLGRKDAAKALAQAAGVPVVPGWKAGERLQGEGDLRAAQLEALTAKALAVGLPLLIKAVAGGGGRGMRLVRQADDLRLALDQAAREAEAAFGDGTLLVERYVERGRHIEVQVLGDHFGRVVHLFERECSIQRRHQKIIEESPSPRLDDALRAMLCGSAVRLAQSVGYTSAGTVEFLLDDATGEFFFLEVNPRLQVEHPVTEMVTGLDLVGWQLAIAQGLPLDFAQSDVQLTGHAIEVRLCAEDPCQAFAPQSGRVWQWLPAKGDGIRVESALNSSDQVPVHYDSLVAKIIAWGSDRMVALARLERALAQTLLFGPASNRIYLQQILATPAFRAGQFDTQFVSQHPPLAEPQPSDADLLAAALWRHGEALGRRFRSNPWRPEVVVLRAGHSGQIHVALQADGPGQFAWSIERDADPLIARLPVGDHRAELVRRTERELVATLDGARRHWYCFAEGNRIFMQDPQGLAVALLEASLLPEPQPPVPAAGSVVASMAAVVTAVHVVPGQQVAADEALLAMEAMKMLTVLRAPQAGKVVAVYAQLGDAVAAGAVLVQLAGEGG